MMNLIKTEKDYFDELISSYFENGYIRITENSYNENLVFLKKLIDNKVIIEEKNAENRLNIEKEEVNKFNRRENKKIVFFKKNYIFYFSNKFLKLYGQEKLKSKKIKSGHDQIIYLLIDHLKKTQSNIYLSNFEVKTKYGISRPDLYVLNNESHINNVIPICYEIKHSHNDFISDIKKKDKRASYLEISQKLFYVCPKDVIKPNEVPEECGLIYMNENKTFDVILDAKEHDTWKENFNNKFILDLVSSIDISKLRVLINEKNDNKSEFIKSDFFKELIVDNNIILSEKQINVMERFKQISNAKLRDLYLFKEDKNLLIEMIALNLISFEKTDNPFIGDYYRGSFNMVKTDQLKNILSVLSESKNVLSVIDRAYHKKFTYNQIKLENNDLFDFYSFNKTKYLDKVNMVGYIKLKNEEHLYDILKNEDFIQKCLDNSQKFGFAVSDLSFNKKLIPKDFSLFSNQYSFNDFPQKEIKRGEKRNLSFVNKQVCWELLKKEYSHIMCYILRN